jgi:hypothetical protein
MGRKLIQSKSSEGYRLFIAAPKGINLLDTFAIEKEISKNVLSEVIRNCINFYEREEVFPSVVSVDSSVESKIRDFLDELELKMRSSFGELRSNPDPKKYSREVFIRVIAPDECVALVKVSSDCSVGKDYNVKLTYCDED